MSALPGTDAEAVVDYAQILRALCNLIGNCVKYCPEGSSATLSASLEDGAVGIRVADDGPGMSAEDQARAFERGWRGAGIGALQGGSGLGLAIVRDLAGQNGGSVRISSRPGAGTTVQILLPVA